MRELKMVDEGPHWDLDGTEKVERQGDNERR